MDYQTSLKPHLFQYSSSNVEKNENYIILKILLIIYIFLNRLNDQQQKRNHLNIKKLALKGHQLSLNVLNPKKTHPNK